MEFKDRLKELRKSLHLSGKEFAAAIGVSTPAISFYENGKIVPRDATLKRIAEVYNVSVDWLKGEDTTARPTSASPSDEERTADATPAVDEKEEQKVEKKRRGRPRKITTPTDAETAPMMEEKTEAPVMEEKVEAPVMEEKPKKRGRKKKAPSMMEEKAAPVVIEEPVADFMPAPITTPTDAETAPVDEKTEKPRRTRKKKSSEVVKREIILESQIGSQITLDEVVERLPGRRNITAVYVKVEENKAYFTTTDGGAGSIELWT